MKQLEHSVQSAKSNSKIFIFEFSSEVRFSAISASDKIKGIKNNANEINGIGKNAAKCSKEVVDKSKSIDT